MRTVEVASISIMLKLYHRFKQKVNNKKNSFPRLQMCHKIANRNVTKRFFFFAYSE